MKTHIKTRWAYRFKNKTFYRSGSRGSFSLSARPYSKAELSTKSLDEATLFPLKVVGLPYDAEFIKGGKWVEVIITTTYETVKV